MKQLEQDEVKDVLVIHIFAGELEVHRYPNTKTGNAAANKMVRDMMDGCDKDEIKEAIEEGHIEDTVDGHCGGMSREIFIYRPDY